MFNLDNLLTQYLKNIEPDNPQLSEYYKAYRLLVDQFGFDPTIKPGQIKLLGWNLEYRCGAALTTFIDSILIRRLNDFIPENDHPLILDCGANIGFSSLSYKRQFPNARIIAFEPDPEFVPILKRNLERNDAADVQVVDAAAWIENGTAQWYCEGIDGSHLSVDSSETIKTTTVRTVDLCDYLNEPIDLIKMDIEGAEFEVIPYLRNHLSQVQAMSIECHINQKTIVPFGKILEVLSSSGFKISLNSYGVWRDLIRQSPILPDHQENYIVVSAWRESSPTALTRTSWVPNAGLIPIRDYENQINYIIQWSNEHEDEMARAAAIREEESTNAASKNEAKLLDYLKNYAISGEKVLKRIHLQKPLSHEIGLCWVTQVLDALPVADNEQFPNRSTMLLFEDDKLLQIAHASHEDIRISGGGWYSHWNETLYFSTSDNSDPNTNGREYRIIYYV